MSILTIEVDFNADAITDDITASAVAGAVSAAARMVMLGSYEHPVVVGGQVVGRARWKGGLLVMSSAWPNTEVAIDNDAKVA